MKYLLIAIINAIYGILLLLTLSSDTPGFYVVLTIGTILTLIGLIGCILWLIIFIKSNKGEVPDDTTIKSWFGLVKSFDIVLIIGLLFRALIVQPFIVDGASMETNFHDKEVMLVDKISYRFDYLKRGDIIIFQAPKNPQFDYIKRIVAMPGEKVAIVSGKVYINDHLLDEPYLTPGTQTLARTDPPLSDTLGPNEYFVMGDNRNNSSDSREWGSVPSINIIGKAWLIIYPFNQKWVIKNPAPIINYSAASRRVSLRASLYLKN